MKTLPHSAKVDIRVHESDIMLINYKKNTVMYVGILLVRAFIIVYNNKQLTYRQC